jgi:tetratricopeptide (TPR) repeat protein
MVDCRLKTFTRITPIAPSGSRNQIDIVLRREATMKKHLAVFFSLLLLMAVAVPQVFAQSAGSVKGVVKDADGKPIADAIVLWTNTDNGQKRPLKTNKQGEYFSLGVTPGTYTATLYKNADDMKANKELYHLGKIHVGLDELVQDFDMKKEAEVQSTGKGLTPEQTKQVQQQQQQVEQAKKENFTIKALNEKIAAANAAAKSGDYDTAIATLTEATQMDATRDILWAQLADAYRGSAIKQTDSAEKAKRFQEATADYGKAIDIKQKAVDAGTAKKPEDAKQLAAYYNNLGEAAGKSGKTDEAIKAYNQAAQVNPEGAAGYYYNAGAVLTNVGKVDDAIIAFDKCIAADPNRADAYYQKGVNMIGKATLQGDKMVAPPGTADAFNKYLELQPTGPYAEVSKQMLASIGASVETGFGTKKKAATTKK